MRAFPIGRPGTHVYVGGLPLAVGEQAVAELFEDRPDRCVLEEVAGELWRDGVQTGRRRYAVVSWVEKPARQEMLERVATNAVVGGKRVVVVVLA